MGGVVNWLTFSNRDFDWHNDFRFDGNKNKVTDLNGHIHRQQHDHPARLSDPGHLDDAAGVLQRDDEDVDPQRHDAVPGPPLPTFDSPYQPSIRWRAFQLVGLLTAERGAIISNSDRPYRFRQHTGDEFLSLLGANGANTAASDSAIKYWALFDDPEKRDNVRPRQLSLTTSCRRFFVSVRPGRTTFTATGAEHQDLGGLSLSGSRLCDERSDPTSDRALDSWRIPRRVRSVFAIRSRSQRQHPSPRLDLMRDMITLNAPRHAHDAHRAAFPTDLSRRRSS
jgi:hypothetical protein